MQAEVLGPLHAWSVGFAAAQRKVEAMRRQGLELDSRRRTVIELNQQARLGFRVQSRAHAGAPPARPRRRGRAEAAPGGEGSVREGAHPHRAHSAHGMGRRASGRVRALADADAPSDAAAEIAAASPYALALP